MEPDLIGQEKFAIYAGDSEVESPAMEPDLIGQEKGHRGPPQPVRRKPAMEPDLIGQEKWNERLHNGPQEVSRNGA